MPQTYPSSAGGAAGEPTEPRLRPVHQQRPYASLRSIGALSLREMATSYGGSPGGYLWAIAEPVGGILLLTLIFSFGFRSPPLGTDFAIFYATGVVPFMAFLGISNKLGLTIRQAKPLLAYPAVTYMDAILAKVFFNTITQLLVAYVVFSSITLMLDTRTDPQLFEIALAFAMTFTFAIGIGMLNCFLFTAFPWWQQIWSIVNRPLFLLSCIFFIFDDVPDQVQPYLWFNPLVHVVGQMRKGFYISYRGDYVSPLYVFAVGLVLMVIGLLLLHRYHRDLLNS
ncbi:ABC transporter permease [Paracoccus marinaquae]|uniref:Transport permease protein n=1 Tax=Paracoccus marinaquae TaxID=2841926 RepID=A0ABS6APD4_9RHOB|nr:ABC transporter permease [Paracoccus marinaquae]MBU3031480.1 ABC transporter permease [Paracoccus marinaquae]